MINDRSDATNPSIPFVDDDDAENGYVMITARHAFGALANDRAPYGDHNAVDDDTDAAIPAVTISHNDLT